MMIKKSTSKKYISSLGGVGLMMSKGGLSASMGPSHLLFIIIIRIEDHLMKVLIIMRNDGMEWNGMD